MSQSSAQTWSACPGKSIINLRVLRSHSLRVESWLPEMTQRLSTDQQRRQTGPTWPSKLHMNSPVYPSHSFTFLSKLPEAMQRPSGEKSTWLMGLPWPTICFTGTLLGSWKSWMVKSSEAVTSRSPCCSVALRQSSSARSCLLLPVKPFPGSKAPLRRTCSVERDMELTQWLCFLCSRRKLPAESKQQMRWSSDPVKISLRPLHSTFVTHLMWFPKARSQLPVSVFHSRTVQSFDPETSRLQSGARCWGIQAREVTHLLWPFNLTCYSVQGWQTVMLPFFQAQASFCPSGAHCTIITQFYALISRMGVCVKTSQSLRVPSPDPEASPLQSGLKERERTASVWPYMLLEARVTGRTLKLETGWQVISRLASKLVQLTCWKKTARRVLISLVRWKKLNSSRSSSGRTPLTSSWNCCGPAVTGTSKTPRDSPRLLVKWTSTFFGTYTAGSSASFIFLRGCIQQSIIGSIVQCQLCAQKRDLIQRRSGVIVNEDSGQQGREWNS